MNITHKAEANTADSGVYVLVTKSSTETSSGEYRVAIGGNIEHIYENLEANTTAIKKLFETSPVFEAKDTALNFAFALADQYGYMEHGICVIQDYEKKTYDELVKS